MSILWGTRWEKCYRLQINNDKQNDEISAYLLSDSIYPNIALAACSAANAKGHMPNNS